MKQNASDPNLYVPPEIKREHLEKLAAYRRTLWEKPDLRMLFIEMTLNCNEHCRHCGSNCGDIRMTNQLTDDEIYETLVKLKEDVPRKLDGTPKLPFLNITGGEPLLRPNFIELMKRIRALGYKWGMTSNGLLIDEKMAEGLKKADMSTISISLDGLKESHDWFRQSPGSYEKTLSGINNLIKTGFKHVMVTTVVHQNNIDELDEILEVVKKTKADCWRVINVEPIGRALTDDSIRLEGIEYKYLIEYILNKRATETEIEVAFGCNHYLGVDREREARSWYFLCNAGLYTASIQYNGELCACLDIERRPELNQGNIRDERLYKLWTDGFKIFRRDKTEESEKCKNCSERRFCGGDGFHTWNFDTHEPRLCLYEEIIKDIN